MPLLFDLNPHHYKLWINVKTNGLINQFFAKVSQFIVPINIIIIIIIIKDTVSIIRSSKKFRSNFVIFLIVLFLLLRRCEGAGGGRKKSSSYVNHTFHQQFWNRPSSVIINKEDDFVSKGKICIGTNGKMSVPSNREHHYRNIKDRYTNCTYVDGNLELTWLEDENLDLSFLQYIREVTGYVLISHVDIKKIVLPHLQIIRGRSLFKMHDDDYALMITLNKMYSVELPALRDILSGSVGMINNYNLCHIKTIDWKEIISDPKGKDVYVYNFTSNERDCSPCHNNCTRGCWGDGPENCQKFSKTTCSPQCAEGRCFGPNPRECCHLFCAGGCTGPTHSDCIACKNFYDNGTCTSECPPMRIYNPTTYSWEMNPNGKYAYGATCVKKCPEHLLKDSGACVRACPSKKRAKDGECVSCDGACPKSCIGDVTVHSGNIDSFENCTIIEGYLLILENTLLGFQQVHDGNFSFGERYKPIHPDRFEVFSAVREITGYLNIQAYSPQFRNLSYFRNLEIIHGRSLHEYSSALYIVKTSLESLELKSLKTIKMGTVAILENKHLCFVDKINWDKIRSNKDHSVMLANNSNSYECRRKGLICDEQCSIDGCWGAGPDRCLACSKFRSGDKCLENCTVEPGIYRANNLECKPCDEQCGSSCAGPGPDKCFDCKNFREGTFCVEKCGPNKYEQDRVCQSCPSTCVDGCTGPKNTVGPGGCNSCDLAIMNENATVDICLHKTDKCPDGYYLEWVGPQLQEESTLRNLGGKAICRKCHPRCKKCTGYGFHELICQECTNFKKGEQCEDECTSDHYPDISTHVCIACHEECKGCSGPGPENCQSCHHFKIYDYDLVGVNNTFKCVESCPPEAAHKHYPENADMYCSVTPPESSQFTVVNNQQVVIYTASALFSVFIIALIAAFVYCYKIREKRDETAMQMTIAMTSSNEDNEPLRPSNVLPNVAQLRIIKETEIRKGIKLGCGAFGVVHKGVWTPDGVHSRTKVPVAIKILRDDANSNSSKEFLSEAYIMASVNHPNLLNLLGVCMTSQLMLITQLISLGCLLEFVRKNHDKIDSKRMLNWCTQIARGMAYLEEKRFVHRDLAARNVLVRNNNCVKITDFGLAKLLDYNEEEYRADGGKMPIKWLALECIQHRIFTHKSDVWAFGVTVWELLTYGGKPYENVQARNVPDLLEKGERLPQPRIATIEVYLKMVSCWILDAESRPCFKQLEEDFSKMSFDPGRYLIIPGDPYMRLQSGLNTPMSDKDMIHSLTMENLDMCETDDYNNIHQPKSRMPFHGGGGTTSSLSGPNSVSPTPDKYWSSSQPVTSYGSSIYPNSQNNFNQKLLRYNQAGLHRNFDSTNLHHHHGTQSDISSLNKYCGDSSLKSRDQNLGSDEYDSSGNNNSQQVQVGKLRLEIPLDEDDYLMPSPQNKPSVSSTTYLDLKNASDHVSNPNLFQNYAELFQNNFDNPEYLMNDDDNLPDQTVGLPDVSNYVLPSSAGTAIIDIPDEINNKARTNIPHKSSEEESDHECYNDFDRLKGELQPLQKNDGSIV